MLTTLDRQIYEVTEILAARRFEKAVIELKYEFAALRFQAAMLRHFVVCRKAGFRENQPLWPSGTPGQSGRWSGGAGSGASEAGTNGAGRIPRGHHYVPSQLYRNEPLKPETRKVFEEGTTGPLYGKAHRFDKAHQEYNEGVIDAFGRFKTKNGIARSEDVTPEQTKKFLDDVKTSSDPRIRGYNMRIYMQEFQFYLRRLPRRID